MTLEEAYAMVEADLAEKNITHVTMVQDSSNASDGKYKFPLSGGADVMRFDFELKTTGGWVRARGDTLFEAVQNLTRNE